MRQGSTKNPSGIGGTIEDVGCLGGFVSHTGGSLIQRRMERNYSKTAHAADRKAQQADPIQPIMDVSGPYRVL